MLFGDDRCLVYNKSKRKGVKVTTKVTTKPKPVVKPEAKHVSPKKHK